MKNVNEYTLSLSLENAVHELKSADAMLQALIVGDIDELEGHQISLIHLSLIRQINVALRKLKVLEPYVFDTAEVYFREKRRGNV